MRDLKVIGIDLAKNIFQLHGTDERGHEVFTKRVRRGSLLTRLSNLPKCTIGIEACGSAHYWAREFMALGHEVKIMAPKYVKPFVGNHKNDANDAQAITEAMMRPRTRFIPLKTVEQQDIQALHRVRSQLIKQRTMLSNQIRGLLGEYGIVLPKGISHVRKHFYSIIEDASKPLTMMSREIFCDLHAQFESIDTRVSRYDKKLEQLAKEHPQCQKLLKIPGIGPISATALVAEIGDVKVFSKGKELAAYLGLVPKQSSSGDKIKLGGISKKGNRYLRYLLCHGARAVMKYSASKTDRLSVWVEDKKKRSHFNAVTVALANKIARYAWAVLSKDEAFNYAQV